MKRDPAFTIPFTSCHFRSAKATGRGDPHALGPEFQGGGYRALHRASESDAPYELQGYVLIETPEQRNRIEQLVELIAHARVVTKGQTNLAEVGHFLVPKPVVSGIEEGTIVELIAGPFKGEKAVVKRVDSGKEEITVELYESVVPIPITVRGDNVRVVEKYSDQQ